MRSRICGVVGFYGRSVAREAILSRVESSDGNRLGSLSATSTRWRLMASSSVMAKTTP